MSASRPKLCDRGSCVEERDHVGECVQPWRATVHLADELVDLVQRCSRCGEVLTDYRNAMVEEGSGPLRGWNEGARVAVAGRNPRMFYTIADDAALEIHETECGRTPS